MLPVFSVSLGRSRPLKQYATRRNVLGKSRLNKRAMKKIRFKLKLSHMQHLGNAAIDPLSVDGLTKDGRIWRSKNVVDAHPPASGSEFNVLKEVARELLPALIKAGYHAQEVENMEFSADVGP